MNNPISKSTVRVEKYVEKVLNLYKNGNISKEEAEKKLSIQESHKELKKYPSVSRLSKQGYEKSAINALLEGLKEMENK
ncbi:hypothetical protein [Staphylococcus pseudoxylosus]|uniref:hypothetical protein n=1 Tax=Staphylococcus pseudoxylosus TaxID=2282419 RepID=UPI002DB98DF8|nr:hypothetical protein [Staphylococcus pseudoxylosus]MEB6038214.1 hypothetical protein [Staphylococcus pseudoxylosus]